MLTRLEPRTASSTPRARISSDSAGPTPGSDRNDRTPAWLRFLLAEDVNFLLTNRIPRRLATRFMGWFSRIESETLTRLSIAVWRRFARDLDLSEARRERFSSLRECFIRELKPGARPIDRDPDVITSPCDAEIGAFGRVRDARAFQAKGFPYSLNDLLRDPDLAARHRDGLFVTLRLRSSMYHRFHAPCDARIREVRYVSGDTWNVNPIALKRIENLFCKNERAVLDLETREPNEAITLVPIAAILVASIELPWLGRALDLSCPGDHVIPCEARFDKGQELGWFQHGSTIVAFASGPFAFARAVAEGATVRVGRPLFVRTNRSPEHPASEAPSSKPPSPIDPEHR